MSKLLVRVMKSKGVWLSFLAALLAASLAVVPVRAEECLPLLPCLQPSPSPSPSPSSSPSPQQTQQPPPQQQPPQQPAPQPSGERPSSSTSQSDPLVPVLEIPVIPRTPSRTTAKLIEILTPLTDRGISLERAMVMTSAPFPVAGYSWFTDDFMFPRYVPIPHLHEGTDIFADFGTPILASGPGAVAAMANTAVGGLSMWVVGDDGTSLYYAHLLDFAPGVQPGVRVDVGTVLGFVGNSGNAITTPPHVHFEIHPPIKDRHGRIVAAGVAVGPTGIGQTLTPAANPKPYLDQWLGEAENRAEAFVVEMVQRMSALARQIHFGRRVEDIYSGQEAWSAGRALWFSFLDPVVASIGLARETVVASMLGTAEPTAALRSAEEQRLAGVKLAVESRDLKLGSFTGRFDGGSTLFVAATPSD